MASSVAETWQVRGKRGGVHGDESTQRTRLASANRSPLVDPSSPDDFEDDRGRAARGLGEDTLRCLAFQPVELLLQSLKTLDLDTHAGLDSTA